jgi:hypothetical protein
LRWPTVTISKKTIKIATFIILIATCALFLFIYYKSSRENHKIESKYSGISLPDNLSQAEVVLKVYGKIGKAVPALFDLKTMQSFSADTFEIYDPWDKERQEYKGPRIIDILEFLELDDAAKEIEVVARNNYKIVIHIDDLKRYGHIFSYSMNGKLYSEYEGKKNKGPLAIAIDFEGHPEMDMEIYKHQLVWLVETVTVK